MAHMQSSPSARNGERPSLRKAFGAFHNVHFRWLWASTLASFSGMQMQLIARGVLAWELSESYAVVGIVEAAFALPMAIFSLPGGAAVDRVEKRRIIVVSQGIMCALAVGTAILVQANLISIVLLFAIGVVQGILFTFNGPARMALLTEVVSEREFTAAISLQNIAMNGTRIVAPAAAGGLIALVSIEGAYYATGILYLFTVFAMLQLPVTRAHLGQVRTTLQREMGDGVRHVLSNHTLRSLMLSGFALAFFIMPYNLMLPGFADGLGHAELFGLMVGVSGVGGLLGSLGIASLTDHPRKPLLQLFIGVAAGIGLVGLGLLSQFFGVAGALVALVVLGGTATAYMTLNQTMLMAESDPAYRGRVMSIFMLTFSAMPLMSLPMGVLADIVGAQTLFIVQGLLVTVVLVLLAFANSKHTFATAGDPPAGDHTLLLPEEPLGQPSSVSASSDEAISRGR
ncbi:MAG: MFS transporter [Dehalococcoidia bacterium]|nr:MAG: MFS transporter [Dehalococcoidia bacterium]